MLNANKLKVSVPSFGDSFFIGVVGKPYAMEMKLVSVPSFGDSFFIRTIALSDTSVSNK